MQMLWSMHRGDISLFKGGFSGLRVKEDQGYLQQISKTLLCLRSTRGRTKKQLGFPQNWDISLSTFCMRFAKDVKWFSFKYQPNRATSRLSHHKGHPKRKI